MQKIAHYIFDLSPGRLAIYLILGPLFLFLVHSTYSIVYRTTSSSSPDQDISAQIILGILTLCLSALILVWFFWLQAVVFSVT